MNNQTENFQMVLNTLGTGAYLAISTVAEIMEKHGYLCTYMKEEEQWWYQGRLVHQKSYLLTFAPPTKEKSSLFSIYQDLEKLTQDYTNLWKNSRMDWSMTTGTWVDVEISGEPL